jgi:hypothetical protein
MPKTTTPTDTWSPAQWNRLIEKSRELFEFVKDYFDGADCGDGGEHGEDMSHGQCWHCTARRLVSEVRGKAR